jgi:esterase/lipase superfamily enzyme
MKYLLFVMLFAACAHQVKNPSKPLQVPPPVTPEVVQPAPVVETPTAPPVEPVEVLSYDEEIQRSIYPVLEKNFQQNFSDTRNIDVLIVTNRIPKGNFFGCTDAQFGVEIDANVKYGLCRINVPKNHVVGQIPQAKNSRQSSHDFFKFLGAKSFDRENFLAQVKRSGRTPLIFVHGFNVRYQEAVLRAAQIAYDLKYQGPIIIFTWPAGAGDGFFDDKFLNKTYDVNAKSAAASVVTFKAFLKTLRNEKIKINLGVHSMGHQMVLPALRDLGVENEGDFVQELILNAPDYRADEFVEMTDVIKKISHRITLYCSYNDKAMIASKTVNDNDRLGACTYSENVDSINVSQLDDDTFALGHGYYSSRAILNDLFQLLIGIDAEHRLFIRKSEPNSTEKYFLRP